MSHRWTWPFLCPACASARSVAVTHARAGQLINNSSTPPDMGPVLSRWSVGRDAVPEREQGGFAVAAVHGLIADRVRPADRQLAGEAAAKEHVGDARALGSWQPRGDERLHLWQLVAMMSGRPECPLGQNGLLCLTTYMCGRSATRAGRQRSGPPRRPCEPSSSVSDSRSLRTWVNRPGSLVVDPRFRFRDRLTPPAAAADRPGIWCAIRRTRPWGVTI